MFRGEGLHEDLPCPVAPSGPPGDLGDELEGFF